MCRYFTWHRALLWFMIKPLNKPTTNSFGSNGSKSLMPLLQVPLIWLAAVARYGSPRRSHLAVPSSFVKTRPETSVVSLNCFAWFMAFLTRCCIQHKQDFMRGRWVHSLNDPFDFSNSFIKLTLFCKRPAVSTNKTSAFFSFCALHRIKRPLLDRLRIATNIQHQPVHPRPLIDRWHRHESIRCSQ